MFLTDAEIFAATLRSFPDDVRAAPNFTRVSAAASTLLATQIETLAYQTEDDTLRILGLIGFPFDSHDEVRLVRAITQQFLERQEEQRAERLQMPLQTFDAVFFRNRHGVLMATFSIGTNTFRPVAMDEEWEVKFVRAWHDALQLALAGHSAPSEE